MSPAPNLQYLAQLEQQNGLPAGILAAQQEQESGFDPNAMSPAGAQGIAQLMPATAQQYGVDPLDPNQASQAEARMMGSLYKKYNGDIPSMLAGYNWGQGNVDRKGLSAAPPETQKYIAKITNGLQKYAGMVGGAIVPDAGAAEINDFSNLSDAELIAEAQKHGIDVPDQQPGFMDHISQDMGNRGQQATDILARTAAGKQSVPLSALQLMGKVGVGGALDIAGEAAKSLIPDAIKNAYSSGAQGIANAIDSTGAGKFAGDTALQALSGYQGYAKAHPAVSDTIDAIANLAGLGMGGKAALTADAAPAISQLGTAANAVKSAVTPAAFPTASEVRTAASAAFKEADAKGGTLTPASTDAWIDEASKVLPQTPAGKLVLGETPTTKLVDRLDELRGKPLTLAETQEIDSALGDAMQSEVHPQTGILNSEGNKLLKIQQSLRDTWENATAANTTGGTGGFEALQQGRSLWAAQAKMNDIERIMNRAADTDNVAQAIRTGFRTLKANPGRMRGFTPVEKTAIARAAKTGLITDALRIAGSRLNPIIAGAAGGGFAGAAGAYALSTGARALATSRQVSRGTKVLKTIASRPVVKTALKKP